MTRVSKSTMDGLRVMSKPQRNAAVAKALLGNPPAELEREVLSYRAALVTALREQGLWPTSSRGRDTRLDP